MVEKRPEFTGPLVNSWPGRLLTLEIARFSVISWDPKKCRNPYICSVISFAYTRPLKLDPQKRGSKSFVFDRAVSKKTPPPGPLTNSSFWNHQKIRGKIAFSDFQVFVFWPIKGPIFFLFWFCSPPKNYPQKFSHSSGLAKKPGKTRVFFLFGGSLFWWWCFSMWCPYARVSLHVPSLLQMCDLALLSYCYFCFHFVFRYFFGGGGIQLFALITSMVLHQWPKKQDQNTENPNIWFCHLKFFVFDVPLWGLHPHTVSSPGPHNNRNPKPSTPENRTCLLDNVLNPVLKCVFLQCLSNINQICPQNRPLTKMITLHNAQNKTGYNWWKKTFQM